MACKNGMEIKFTCQIKEVRTKMLVSSDKSTQILLQQDNLREEVINALNELINSQQNESKELVVSLQDSVK